MDRLLLVFAFLVSPATGAAQYQEQRSAKAAPERNQADPKQPAVQQPGRAVQEPAPTPPARSSPDVSWGWMVMGITVIVLFTAGLLMLASTSGLNRHWVEHIDHYEFDHRRVGVPPSEP